ncbi:MAG: hypothetical protein QCH31_11920, partial [Methanolobus sp.]|nr:hypothetical protein [Methanolobus sp.]
NRNGNWDIYMYDISSGIEYQITTNQSSQSNPAIYQDRIVWMDSRTGNWDIYMYDISSGIEYQITTNQSGQSNPAIYQDRIVWRDGRNGNLDVYMFTLENPAASIGNLKEYIDSHDINIGIKTSLNAKLDNALKQLKKGDEDKAIKKLKDFISFVNTIQMAGKLTDTQVIELTNEAEKILNSIQRSEG